MYCKVRKKCEGILRIQFRHILSKESFKYNVGMSRKKKICKLLRKNRTKNEGWSVDLLCDKSYVQIDYRQLNANENDAA